MPTTKLETDAHKKKSVLSVLQVLLVLPTTHRNERAVASQNKNIVFLVQEMLRVKNVIIK
jgi:hypothetical protein